MVCNFFSFRVPYFSFLIINSFNSLWRLLLIVKFEHMNLFIILSEIICAQAARILATLIVYGSGAVIRACTQAYRQALASICLSFLLQQSSSALYSKFSFLSFGY